MPKLRTVEKQIERCEGFRVRFRDAQTGRDIRGDRPDIPSYTYKKMAKNKWSVTKYKAERFMTCYPGFEVDVLNSNGYVAHGRTLLGTVRDTYL